MDMKVFLRRNGWEVATYDSDIKKERTRKISSYFVM
jgi:hypothetical protein